MQSISDYRRTFLAFWLAANLVACLMLGGLDEAAAQGSPVKVLQVGTFHGKRGQYSSVQDAVNDAKPGDWILIAPGTYKENGSAIAGIWISTPGIHLRGMDRNRAIVDGTNPGFGTCSSDPAAQNFGAGGAGRNGIEVYQADGVTVENLTVCNFMGDSYGNNGNQIWWNGGDGSGVIGMGSWRGSYLTASSTFYQAGTPNTAQYGIFVSNAKGPGSVSWAYASNMGDSGFYIGACADCNATLRYVHAQNNPQGFSGSNSGGHLVLEDSEWDHNQAGIVPSSLAVYDPPSPQNGACPNNPAASCTLIQRNYIHDNNNPNTPGAGIAITVPVGTGVVLSGSQNDTVQFNYIANNGSWGVLVNDYADYSSAPFPTTYCQGGESSYTPPGEYYLLYYPQVPIPCYFRAFGNNVAHNVFAGNGFFGNLTNGDLADAALPFRINNCFVENIDLQTGEPSSSPVNLPSSCGRPWSPDTTEELDLTEEVGCASIALCANLPFPLNRPPVYPVQTQVKLLPIPQQPGMPDPCAGVPQNTWCSDGP